MDARNPQDDEAALERLLREARWPEADPERLARLQDRWSELRQAPRRARWIYAAVATAAALVLAAGTVVWQMSQSDVGRPMAQPGEAPTVDPGLARARTHAPLDQERPAPPEKTTRELTSAGEDPNLYERVVMSLHVRKRRPKSEAATRGLRDEQLEDRIAALGDADQAPEAVQPMAITPRQEKSLAQIVSQSTGSRRTGAARLLAQVATDRSIPALAELWNDPELHATAAGALARLVSAPQLARMATAERDGALRRQLLAALLARGTGESVGLYLGLVRRPETTSDALDAVALVTPPPTDALIVFLRSPQPTVREAAAEVAARITDPDALARIAASATDGAGRQEVLLALLMNPSPGAARLVEQARQDLYLLAAVCAAEHHLLEMTDSPRR